MTKELKLSDLERALLECKNVQGHRSGSVLFVCHYPTEMIVSFVHPASPFASPFDSVHYLGISKADKNFSSIEEALDEMCQEFQEIFCLYIAEVSSKSFFLLNESSLAYLREIFANIKIDINKETNDGFF